MAALSDGQGEVAVDPLIDSLSKGNEAKVPGSTAPAAVGKPLETAPARTTLLPAADPETETGALVETPAPQARADTRGTGGLAETRPAISTETQALLEALAATEEAETADVAPAPAAEAPRPAAEAPRPTAEAPRPIVEAPIAPTASAPPLATQTDSTTASGRPIARRETTAAATAVEQPPARERAPAQQRPQAEPAAPPARVAALPATAAPAPKSAVIAVLPEPEKTLGGAADGPSAVALAPAEAAAPTPSTTADATAAPAPAPGGAAAVVRAPPSAAAEAPAQVAALPPQRQVLAPDFDVLRVDRDGNTVIAGRAEPSCTVTVRDGERVLGTATADARGEWVLLPDTPLAPGSREIGLAADCGPLGTMEADRVVILVVPEPGVDVAGRTTAGRSTALALSVPRSGAGATVVLQAPPADQPPTVAAEALPAGETPPQVAAAPARRVRLFPEPSAARSVEPAPPASVSVTPGAAVEGPATGQPAAPASLSGGTNSDVSAPGIAAAPEPVVPSAQRAGAEATSVQVAPRPATEPDAGTAAQAQVADLGTPAADPTLALQLSLDVIDYSELGALRLSGRAAIDALLQVYLDNRLVGRTRAGTDGRWLLSPDQAVAPGLYKLRVDQVRPDGTVVARIELPFLRGQPLADLPPGELVIVQPGNSLWRIARRAYGEGLQYTLIFDANRNQIRNEDLIYPGQVFRLPSIN